MDGLRHLYPVRTLCPVLALSVSGYYSWLNRQKKPRANREPALKVAILTVHQKSRETYGAERIRASLVEKGISVGMWTVKKLRREMGLVCRQRRHWKQKAWSMEQLPAAPNILNRQFHVVRSNTIWMSDITYIRTREGWLYVAGIKDGCTKEIIGYAFSSQMTASLVLQAVRKALEKCRPSGNLVLHSDQGGQYRSAAYTKFLKKNNITISMSRRGNCYDNAPMESFWGLLKTEWLRGQGLLSMRQAETAIREYIEEFYNRFRIQKGLGYRSPSAYAAWKKRTEKKFYGVRP